jgi:hypothetical protein
VTHLEEGDGSGAVSCTSLERLLVPRSPELDGGSELPIEEVTLVAERRPPLGSSRLRGVVVATLVALTAAVALLPERTHEEVARTPVRELAKPSQQARAAALTSMLPVALGAQPTAGVLATAKAVTGAEATPGSAAPGLLTLSSQPKVEVLIDRVRAGSTPLAGLEVEAGVRHIELRNWRLGIYRTLELDIVSGEELRQVVTFEMGQLRITAPVPLEIATRGRVLGVTPLDIEIYEGVHPLTVLDPASGIRRVHRVEIKAGVLTQVALGALATSPAHPSVEDANPSSSAGGTTDASAKQ